MPPSSGKISLSNRKSNDGLRKSPKSRMLIGFQALVFLIACSNHALAAEFAGICPNGNCVAQLDADGLSIDGERIANNLVYQWKSSRSSPFTTAQRGVKTAKGAIIGGLAGAVLLGPIGAAVGAVWGGSEESSGDASPDMYFQLMGFKADGSLVTLNIRFENPDVARRFRMQLPMFTNLLSGETRNLSFIRSQLPADASIKSGMKP